MFDLKKERFLLLVFVVSFFAFEWNQTFLLLLTHKDAFTFKKGEFKLSDLFCGTIEACLFQNGSIVYSHVSKSTVRQFQFAIAVSTDR